MTKYIIKNCPATKGTKGFCGDDRKEIFCQDCTDCLLKRIVEKTKKYINDEADFSPEELLSILEIEECEE